MAKLFVLLIVLGLTNCMPPHDDPKIRATSYTVPDDSSALYKCLTNAMIVFHPDSVTTKALLAADWPVTFVEERAVFDRYSRWLEDTLKRTNVRYIKSTAKHIVVDNGTSRTVFDFANDGRYSGCILSRPGVRAEVYNGIFTDADYRRLMRDFFER